MTPSTWDAVVVGAGPAGAVAALELARAGASVLLVDRAPFPRWKVCGACLSAGALDTLAAAGLGDVVASRGGVPLERFEVADRGGRASLPLPGGAALSRTAFDAALVETAVRAGARFAQGWRASLGAVTGGARRLLTSGDGAPESVAARVVVDATGLGAGLRPPGGRAGDAAEARGDRIAPGSRVGLGATLEADDYPLAPGALHMVVGRHGYVGLVRLEDGSLNVGAAVDPAALSRAAPAGAPAGVVASILAEAGLPPLEGALREGWRGTPALSRRPEAVGAERLLRVGDAAGYVEPFTGEGMCWALSSGLAAASVAGDALEGWRPELLERWSTYQATAMAEARRLCRALSWGLRRPGLVRGALAAVGRFPALAAPFARRATRPPRPIRAAAGPR